MILNLILMLASSMILSDFQNAESTDDWYIVNDGVMGGKSQGDFYFDEKGYALFTGDVSLKNNGGFTSVRHDFNAQDINGRTMVKITLKGDKKNYQFRTKEEREKRFQFKYEFQTSGKWETIEIPLKEMTPSWRGMRPNVPNFSATTLNQIGFLIANKKNEKFELRIKKIWLE